MDSWLVLVANGKAGTISALEYSGSRLRPLADNRIGAQGMPLAVAAERGLVFAGTIDPWLIRVLAVDRATGRLTEIHRLPIAGNPVHLALSANGRWLAMASYHDGLGQLCRVEADGVLEPIGEPVRHRNLHSAAITADTRHCYNYAVYLAAYPTDHEAVLHENTSWSCAHGLERWETHCGCSDGGHPDWTQDWRRPLRRSLNYLKYYADEHFFRRGAEFFTDPNLALREYGLTLAGTEDLESFLNRHGRNMRCILI